MGGSLSEEEAPDGPQMGDQTQPEDTGEHQDQARGRRDKGLCGMPTAVYPWSSHLTFPYCILSSLVAKGGGLVLEA